MFDEYNRSHPEALDVEKLRRDEGGNSKTDLQRLVEFKQSEDARMLRELKEKIEDEKRAFRTRATIEELIKTEIFDKADEVKAQMSEGLKNFLSRKNPKDRDGAEFQ